VPERGLWKLCFWDPLGLPYHTFLLLLLPQDTVPHSMCNGGGVTLFYRQESDFTSHLVADGYDCTVAPPGLAAVPGVLDLALR